MANPPTLSYVGRKSCGCLVAWASADVPKRDLAKTVAEWVRSGLSIERMTTDEAREALHSCTHRESKNVQRDIFAPTAEAPSGVAHG